MPDSKFSIVEVWRKPLSILIPITIIIVIVGWWWCWWYHPPVTTVYVVRHAEKAAGSGNVSLTPAGQERARSLASLLQSAGLDAAYSTEYCRTAQTIQPAAQAHNLNLSVLTLSGAQANFDDCDPVIQIQTQISNASSNHASTVANHILANYRGKDVLIAGHSDTAPEIVAALGASSLCPDLAPLDNDGECHIPSDQFNNLFVVTVYASGRAKAVRLRYSAVWLQIATP